MHENAFKQMKVTVLCSSYFCWSFAKINYFFIRLGAQFSDINDSCNPNTFQSRSRSVG